MNKVVLVGNLTKEPEKRATPQGVSVTTFTVATQKRFKNANGGYDADFINCVAWRATADFVAQYFVKGSRIGVVGSLQTRSYDDKDGNKRYVTEVVADEVEFCGSKKANSRLDYTSNEQPPETDDDIFGDELSEIYDEDLPF